MAEPLRIILIVSAICSGIYAVLFVKNAVATGQVNFEYVLWIFVGFVICAGIGFTIWGIAVLIQRIARKIKSGRPGAGHPGIRPT
ncbi:MAG: hypothetical protein JW901_11165 [Dehalococcoidia bacterium]|nr:hypothetical protein [Dehalococcoidia bacterium]